MKIFIILTSIAGLVVAVLTAQSNANAHRTCSCAGTFCNCSITCLDKGEIPNCSCSTFSCICSCNPKDHLTAGDIQLPTMDINQQENSRRAESYFKGLGTPHGDALAIAIRSLRDAVLSSDKLAYLTNSRSAEETFQAMPAAGRQSYEDWASANLIR